MVQHMKRPLLTNNQGIEQENTVSIALGDQSAVTSSKGIIERWLDVSRKQERLTANRWEEIQIGKPYEEKRKDL